MKIVNSDEMRELESRCADEGISTDQLMENAGLAVAEEIRAWRDGVAGAHIAVLVGPGNNGGDGLVAARHLHDWGANVYIYLCTNRPESDPNLKPLVDRDVSLEQAQSDKGQESLCQMLRLADVVVDGVLGTGKARPIEGTLKEVFAAVRDARAGPSRLRIVALDLPSGLDADSGQVDPSTLSADLTITLGYPKVGLFTFPGAQTVGRVTVATIGIHPRLAEGITLEMMTPEGARSSLPDRPYDAHKGAFGRVLAVVGSMSYVGAAALACHGAGRVGAGIVTLACPKTLLPIMAAQLTETTYLPLSESEPGLPGDEALSQITDQLPEASALLVGCGLGQEKRTKELVHRLLLRDGANFPPTVVDADGLNALADEPRWWERLNDQTVLTPHPGEMGRLLDLSNREVQSDRLGVARRAAEQWNKVVVLKGAHTVVARPDGHAKLSPFANPGLASAGTGDVLAGAIAGVMAQGLSPWDAATCGVYLHGMAGAAAREELGEAGILASDLLPLLPRAIKELKEG